MSYYKDFPGRIRYGELEDEDFSVLFELGMPAEAPRFKATYPGVQWGPNFKDFTVELVGVIDNSAEIPSKEYVNTIEIMRKRGVPERGLAWRRRVFHKSTKAYIEAIWNPEYGTQISIEYIEGAPLKSRVAEVRKLVEGLQLTLIPVQQGRYRIKSPEQVYEEAVKFCADFLKKHGKLPTANQTMRAVGRSKSRFYEDLADCGRTFDLVREEARSINKSDHA
jgi:hypothetical protein